METACLMEIKDADVARHLAAAYEAMKASKHAPTAAVPALATAPAIGATGRPVLLGVGALAAGPGARPAETVSLLDAVFGVSKDDPLTSGAENHVLRVVRRGIAVARAVADLFESTSELGKLKEQHAVGRLTEAQRTLFTELQYSAALITGFVAASYAAWALGDFMPEAQSPVEAPEPSELRFDHPPAAIAAYVWELAAVVRAQGRDDASLVKLVRESAAKRAQAIALRAQGAKHLDRFIGAHYRVEGEDFTVKGFAAAAKTRADALVMTFKKPEEVVGNHIAKQQALRLSKMLLSYDFKAQTSPFVLLGGHVFTFMGDGNPGTGKTTLIQMMCGLINDYCKMAGYTFRYRNFGPDNIDSYQGKSGQNCRAFIDHILDPTCIGFGTVDDIDQVAGKRGDKQSSAGQQEVTAVLMEAFAGANTVVRGNCAFGMFSNYPENVDDALRQRAGARFLIDGPQSLEDYRDLLAILLGRNTVARIGLGKAEGQLFVTQAIKEAAKKAYEKHNRPQEKAIADIYDRVVAELGQLTDLHKVAVYLKRIQEFEPRFTGRAVKNITDAVKTRAMDVDLPDLWFENPEEFLWQPIERKTAMIQELMEPVTHTMLLQEINRYADSEARYSDKSFDAAVAAAVRDHDVRQAALTAIQAR